MRRSVVPIYALILLETIVWIAIVPLAPTFSAELGLTGVETGTILSASSFAALLVSFPLGWLADRLGSREVTIASAVLFTLATLGQGLADTFWSLLLARGAFGVAFGALWGAGAAWLSDSLSDDRRAGGLGAVAPVAGVGFTTGPVFAGALADRYFTGASFLVVSVAAALVTVALLVAAPGPPGPPPKQSLGELLRVARRDELVLAGIALIALIGLVGGGVNLLVPLRLRANDVSAGEIGLLLSVASAVYTVVSGVVARLGSRAATLRVGGLAALGAGLSFVFLLGSGSTLAAVAFVLVRAPFWSTMDTIIYPLAAAGAHRSGLGRGSVLGLVMLGWGIASTLGPLLAGGIADVGGERAASAVLVSVCLLVGWWLVRMHRGPVGVDLERLYGARDLDQLQREYDRIAGAYDELVGRDMGYRSPAAVVEVARRLLAPDDRILDAGAGTGLLGVALAEAGFTRLDGLDLSPGMLAEAARKRVYGDLRQARLGDPLAYETGCYDGVVSAGVLTVGHAPASCLDELVRVTRAGGHVIFTLRSDQVPPGFEEKIAELERAGRWKLVERGEEFQALPLGEPEVRVRVWAFRVLRAGADGG
ncbi:MAG TPA: MFS transporter [Gaiellaceae bacterium]|nr:MFS transporter [Gaiellaceae bacterium]